MSDKIPPRPWYVPDARVAARDFTPCDVNNEPINGDDAIMSRATADLIVRLVNAEPEIVAALEAAERYIAGMAEMARVGEPPQLTKVRAALAKVRP